MTVGVITKELKLLRSAIQELEAKFLAGHLGNPGLGLPSASEQLDVAAYIVLSHGVFERFVEGLAKCLSARIVDRWLNGQVAKAGAAALLLHEKPPKVKVGETVYDMLRLALDQAKSGMAGTINMNNGVSSQDLAELFHPLAVDLPQEPTLVAQMELLIAWRHDWAHKHSPGANGVKTAADAKQTVKDCVAFAERLAENVRRSWP